MRIEANSYSVANLRWSAPSSRFYRQPSRKPLSHRCNRQLANFSQSQISDGQVQAETGTPAAYTGGMPRPTAGLSGLIAAGLVGAAAFL